MHVNEYWSHSFIMDRVKPDGIVFDFGVNDGGFAKLVATRCRRVIGFEPDPSWRGRWNLPDNVIVHPMALAGKKGTLAFHVNPESCSSLHYTEAGAHTVEVEAITLAEALAMEPDGLIDLIKMDIEGEELTVLQTAPPELFDRVAQMTVEFHDFMDPSSLPRVREVIARMRSLGYYAFCFSWRSHGDLLFLHRRLVPLSLWQRFWLLFRFKYLRGLLRIIRRTLKLAPAA